MSDTHAPNVQHHFRDIAHQHDAAKLGIWLFLATEILLFGVYSVGMQFFVRTIQISSHGVNNF